MSSIRHSNGNSNDIHKSYQGYESLKSNLVEFPSIDLSRTRTNSLDPAVRSLRIKVTEMETILKISRERVRLLEKTVDELSIQLEKCQAINRALLNEKLDLNSTDVHFFVQDLIVSDIKKKLEEAQFDIEKYRLDSERMKKRYEAILQENKKIEGSIKRYRKIISDIGLQKLQSSDAASTIEDAESVLPSIKKTHNDIPKGKNAEKQRVKPLPILEQHIKEMSEASAIPVIFTKVCNALRLITGSQKVSLYLISPTVQQAYISYFQSIQYVQRVLLGNT